MLRISWVDKVTNRVIMERMKDLEVMKRRKFESWTYYEKREQISPFTVRSPRESLWQKATRKKEKRKEECHGLKTTTKSSCPG